MDSLSAETFCTFISQNHSWTLNEFFRHLYLLRLPQQKCTYLPIVLFLFYLFLRVFFILSSLP